MIQGSKKFLVLFAKIAITFLAYALAAHLGLKLATINQQASPVWPATGIAIAFIYLLDFPVAIGVLIGAFLSNYLTGLSFLPSAFIAIGNTLEAIVAVIIFRYLFRRTNALGQHARLVFSLIALFLAAMVSSTIGSFTLLLLNVIKSDTFFNNWITWWVGDSLGALFIAPFAYKIMAKEFHPFSLKPNQAFLLIATLVATVALNYLVFTSSGAAFFFVVFVPLLFVARTFDGSWIYIVSLIICSQSILGTLYGNGPFVGGSVNESLIRLQLFLASLGITAIGLGTLKPERFPKRTMLALLGGWLLCGIAFFSFYKLGKEKDRSYFTYKVAESHDAIEEALNRHITLLEAGISFFEASDYVSESEWRSFTRRSIESSSTLGVHGIGVIFKSSTTDKKKFIEETGLKETLENFHIHPVNNIPDSQKVKSPDSHFVITFLEPRQPNLNAVGLDIATEALRLEAAMRAASTGRAAITKPIQLVQDSHSRPGFLLFVPFYRKGAETDTPAERLRALKGFIYAPYLAEEFFSSTLRLHEKEVKVSVYAGEKVDPANLIYKSSTPSALSKDSIVEHTEIGGLKATLVWNVGKSFDSSSSLIAAWLGFSGALCSLFLAIMISSLEGLTLRAQKMADEMNRELEERRRLWQTLAETSPVGIYLTNEKGECTYVNPTWVKITGIRSEVALEGGWVNAIHPEDRQGVLKDWQKIYAGQKFKSSFRFCKSTGEIIYVVSEAVAMKNEDGAVSGYVGTVQDITELHHQQDALVASSRLSSLGEMASGIAHEINNPLTIILGKARKIETLLKSAPTDVENILGQSQQIAKTAHRISKIIKGLQAFARETSSEPFQPVKVDEMIQNTLELCQERFSKYSTELRFNRLSGPPLLFWGREEQIAQVIMNLLNNAFDAVQHLEQKWVQIDVRHIGDKIQICVIDSGLGISEEIEAKIFNPFFTTKEIGKGTGLGLSISKGIIERHNGRIFVDRSSKHTQFVVELNEYVEKVELKKAN